MDTRRIIGTLLFLGSAQFSMLLIVAETQYPGYNVAANYISDLGNWSYPSAYIFNPSIALNGALLLAAAYLIMTKHGWRSQGALLFITGMGALGVGFFNEFTGAPHVIFALMAFIGGSFSGIIFKRRIKGPMGHVGLILGCISLLALMLLGSGLYLGLGAGGMERMILYPQLAFTLGLGGYFLAGQAE